MKRTRLSLSPLVILVLVFTSHVKAQPAAVRNYVLVDLGTLGGASSEALGINNLGEIVGWSTTSLGTAHAFFYRNGRVMDLGTLVGGSWSAATAVSDRGQVVGYSAINAYGPQFRESVQAFLWQDETIRSLGALFCPCSFNRRYGSSAAFALNNAGQVVGDSQTPMGETFRHAFGWQEDQLVDLGRETDSSVSFAYGINDRAEIVGASSGHAFLWNGVSGKDLGTLAGYTTSTARAINNKGQVVGESVEGRNEISRAFLWDQETMSELGTLPGDRSSQARAINVEGEVVGRSGTADLSASRAFIWQNGEIRDLNTLRSEPGWVLTSANGINDVGEIVGVGLLNGQTRAFLLTSR